VRRAEHAGAPDARATFTAQLVAVRREQGRLHDLIPAIEGLAGDEPAAAAWRCVAPLAYLDAGDRPRAWAAYERALGSVPRTMLWLTATASLAEAAAVLGDAEGADRLYTELEPYADRFVQWGFTGNAGSVQRLLGRTAAAAGRPQQAAVHFTEALARHTEVGAAALAARTRCDYGELLMRGTPDERREGSRLLRRARAAARGIGMAGVAARAGTALDMEDRRCSS
jgi:tetratricopeptide (TPR) repeat protein